MSRRPNLDFAAVDLRAGFTARAGGVAGITEKVLASSLDPAGRTGCRTRLLRLAPGTRTPEAHALAVCVNTLTTIVAPVYSPPSEPI